MHIVFSALGIPEDRRNGSGSRSSTARPIVSRIASALAASLCAMGFFAGTAAFAATSAPNGTPPSCPVENFDGVSAPDLPAGWMFTTAPDNTGPGTFTTVTTASDTAPNAAFAPDFVSTTGAINDVRLMSPVFVPAQGTALTFRNQWNLRTNASGTVYYDGGVLEISIDGGAYQDIVAAGGGFTEGGYNLTRRITTSGGSPIGNRFAWAASSGGAFVTSTVALPPAATGRPTRIRFRSAISGNTIALPAGSPGWWIDSVSCVTAPPSLTQAFSPTNTPVGASTTLTLSLNYPSGGALLTSDLVNTLPSGLNIAAVPNATTTCTGGSVSNTANSLTLASGAQIPAAGCTVSVDVSAAAPGIYVNTLAAGALQTTAGANPAQTSANYQAIQDGLATYATGFEAPTYAIGNLNAQDGWTRVLFGLNDVKVANTHPKAGAQHLRVQPLTPDGTGFRGYNSTVFPAGTTSYSVATMNVSTPTVGTPAPFEFAAQDLDEASGQALPITRIRYNSDFNIQVLDAAVGGYVNTGATWTQSSAYSQLRIVTRRADASILVCLDGSPIYSGHGAASNLRSVLFGVVRQPGVSTNIWDIDDVAILDRNFGGCGDTPGALTAPLVGKSFAPATVVTDTDSTATVTLTNPNASAITLGADLVDLLPANLVATAASTTCSGTASFTAGSFRLASGASIPAEASCTLSATVRSSIVSDYVNTINAGALQTNAGANPLAATATLSVTPAPLPPTLSKSFAPDHVQVGVNSTARITLSNPNANPITLTADLVDTLPAGLVASIASTTCNGVASFTAGTLKLASGATIPANGSCVLSGTVKSSASANYVNTIPAGGLQTSVGSNTSPASATLTVMDTAGGVTLRRTVGTDLSAGACGAQTSLLVQARTAVNFCYRLTNNTSVTLEYQTVQSNTYGRLLNYQPISLAPGQTYQFNDIRIMTADLIDLAVWNGDDVLANYDFVMNPGTVAWDDISATGAIFTNDITTTIPFGFNFFAEPQNAIDVVDGGLAFGRANASFPNVNTDLPSPSTSMPLTVLPYWDNWTSLYGTLFWQVKGTAPDRRLIVQWQDRKFSSSNPNGMRYQAVLFEGTGQIAFVYNQVDNGETNPGSSTYQNSFGKSASIGLNFDATRASRVSYFPEAPNQSPTPVINNGDSIVFSPTPLTRFSDTEVIAVTVVSPQVVVDESPISVTVGATSNATRDFVIGNSGTANLLWEVDPALAGGMHLPSTSQSWPSQSALGAVPDNSFVFPRSPAAGAQVPGYVYTLSSTGATLASFDVANPQTLQTIASYPITTNFDVTGFEFVGTDFTKAYSLAYSNGAFQSFDTTTGAANLIGYAQADSSGINEARQDMAYDPVSGMLYMLTLQTTTPATLVLYTIDPADGKSMKAVQLQGMGNSYMNAIGINSQGQMFGIDYSQDRLIAIDKLTGETSPVGPLGFNANGDQSLEYDDASDTMYWIGGIFQPPPSGNRYEVFTVNTETGAATYVSDFTDDATHIGTSGFAIARANPCMLPSQVPWLTLSETSGVVGPTDTDTVHMTFNGSGLADGEYSALICLSSNDLTRPRIRVPVSMTVGNDIIFRSGFEFQ